MPLNNALEFALSFTADAVHLQHRDPAGDDTGDWQDLGEVPFAAPDFSDRLGALRLQASGGAGGLQEGWLPVVLMIPQDQILYTSLDVPEGPHRGPAVGQALEGLTPYAIDELSFDWTEEGRGVRVAAVARQTLIEALDFAQAHGFSGAGFSALPQNDDYPRQPAFLLTDPEVDEGDEPLDPANPLDPLPSAQELTTDIPDLQEPEAGFDGLPSQPDLEPATQPDEDGFADPQQRLPLPDEAEPACGQDEAADFLTSDEQPFGPAIDVPQPDADPQDELAEAVSADVLFDPIEETVEQDKEAIEEVVDEAEFQVEKPQPVPVKAPEPVLAAPVRPLIAKNKPEPAPIVVRHGSATAAAAPRPAGVSSPRAQGPKPTGRRSGLVELVAMLGALMIGLLLVWAFFVPRDNPAQQPGQEIAVVDTVQPGPDQAEPTAELPQDAVIENAPLTDQQAAVEDAVTGAQQIDQAEAVGPDQTTAQAGPVTTVPELSPEDQARLIEAATKPAQVISQAPLARPDSVALAAQKAAAEAAEGERALLAAAEQARQLEAEQQAQAAATEPASDAVAASDVAETPSPAPSTQRLTSSARPISAPRRTSTAPKADTPPVIPADPLPFEAAQRPVVPSTSARPPSRPSSRPTAPVQTAPAAPAATPEQPAAPVTTPTAASLRSSSRPPARPQGSAPDTVAGQPLTAQEQDHIDQVLRDFYQHSMALPDSYDRRAGLVAPEAAYRVAELRPSRRPASVEARAGQAVTTSDAVDNAIRSATETSPPDRPAASPSNASASTMPARNTGGHLTVSARPTARPGTKTAATASGVDAALSEAVSSAAALPSALPGGSGGVMALTSSRLPPRKTRGAAGSVETAALAATPSGGEEAEQAERRRIDEQLQSQAEARIRARAAADAAAEATARAEAEARARAQVAAEERAAAASRQSYKPQEVDDEPEVAQAVSRGPTAATVASAATQQRGLNMGRTTIIGIIGAGQASRALIRLRNGKIVTVRLGDKIDGGVITSIGDGKVTYAKAGRQHELRLLDGR